jgi:hypothetical protein
MTLLDLRAFYSSMEIICHTLKIKSKNRAKKLKEKKQVNHGGI